MTTYGRVFRMEIEDQSGHRTSEGIFMVVGPSASPDLRDSDYFRYTVCVTGTGWWAGGLVQSGEMIPVYCDDPRIEWLD